MTEHQSPADPVGDDSMMADAIELDAPLPDEVALPDTDEPTPETGQDQGDAPDAVAEDGEAEAKPDAMDGDDTPPAEEKSRSALRRERQRKHVEEVTERAKKAEAALEAIRSAKDSEVEPKEADFTDYTDYAAAKAVWAASNHRSDREAEAAKKAHDAAVAERNAARQAVWQEQVQAAKAVYQDFEKVAYRAPLSDIMTEVILSSDMGAEVAYHLGSHVSEAARIAAMSPLDAARELGRIEAKLSAPKPRTATKAPPPVRPVKASGGPVSKDPGQMTMAEYEAWRRGK